MILLVAAALSMFLGATTLALSQSPHHKKVSILNPWSMNRSTGWGLICLSLVFCIVGEGFSFALVFWPRLTTGGCCCITIKLAFRPTQLKSLA
jgi:hypothetical protein